MAVEKAPYINYTEVTSYQENIVNGSEIPLFIVKTNNEVSVSDINPRSILRFVSYLKFKEHFNINPDSYDSLDSSIKELDATIKDFFVENSMYGEGDYGLSVPYIFMIDVGNAPTVEHYIQALLVSETKRKSTVVLFPNCEDVNFMMQVDTQLKLSTKTGLLRIGYFGVSSQGQSEDYALGDILKPKNPLNNYESVVEGYKDGNKLYEDSEHTTEITLSTNKLYLDITQNAQHIPLNKSYVYNGTALEEIETSIISDMLVYASDDDYKLLIPSTTTEVDNNSETFSQFCERMKYISNKVQSSRIAIVEKEYFGKTIARICSTPYYIEPGYLPYMSVNLGVFDEYTGDERDELFATGLIFNEDDYTLPTITPRICLATSTAWGIDDHDMRTTDALIHARRNVDYQIRKLLEIIAPQLKRNETSVNLRFVENQIDIYLNRELDNGRIMEYAFEVRESSYNPYALKIIGKITPVNCTLAIEFENTVGSPHAIASDYV